MDYTLIIEGGIYNDEWMGGNNSLSRISNELKAFDFEKDTLTVIINSYGGDVFLGLSIYEMLKDYRPTVKALGIVGSAASIIAMAGETILMAETASLLIHRASSGSYGNSKAHEKIARELAQIDNSIAKIYSKKSKMNLKTILELMDADESMNAEKALEHGLIDEIFNTYNDEDLAIEQSANIKNKAAKQYETLLSKGFMPEFIRDMITNISDKSLGTTKEINNKLFIQSKENSMQGEPTQGNITNEAIERLINSIETFVGNQSSQPDEKAVTKLIELNNEAKSAMIQQKNEIVTLNENIKLISTERETLQNELTNATKAIAEMNEKAIETEIENFVAIHSDKIAPAEIETVKAELLAFKKNADLKYADGKTFFQKRCEEIENSAGYSYLNKPLTTNNVQAPAANKIPHDLKGQTPEIQDLGIRAYMAENKINDYSQAMIELNNIGRL